MMRINPKHLSKIPLRMHPGIIRYIEEGILPGSFLTAFLANDLFKAIGTADDENINLFLEYRDFLYNHAPAECWGSADCVREWHLIGGIKGLLETQKGRNGQDNREELPQ